MDYAPSFLLYFYYLCSSIGDLVFDLRALNPNRSLNPEQILFDCLETLVLLFALVLILVSFSNSSHHVRRNYW